MKTKQWIPFLLTGLGAGALGLVFGWWIRPTYDSGEAALVGHASDPLPKVWTCSMHPQIHQPGPGACPICGMDLIPLEVGGGDELGPRSLSMSEASRALAEIQTEVVERRFPEVVVRIVGQLDYDETREKTLSARFGARIDRLFVNFTGISVKTGEHLAEVYSPDLLNAQRELLTAYRNESGGSMAAAAREKLHLWDLLPDQIDAIIASGTASDRFELRAPIGGVVVSKNVQEGDYVKTGEPLFRIVDLSVLWLNLEAYESDLPWLRYGQTVEFTVEAYPGEAFTGQIAFIEPELNRKTRTVPVRINVPNPDGRLKPGMFARGQVQVRIAEGGKVYAPEFSGKWISPMHPEIVKEGPGQCDICGMDLVPAESLGFVDRTASVEPVVIPASAVLRTGKRAVVYVRMPDSGRPTFEGREIVLGPRAGDDFIVVSGVEPGEAVVMHGAFKIDSALQIQARPSMMNPVDPDAEDRNVLTIDSSQAQVLLPAYLRLQAALAADDLAAAQAALQSMGAVVRHVGALSDLVHEMMRAEDLDTMRRPHFEVLSNALIAAVQKEPRAFSETLLRMHCPMVYPDRGADWIQTREPLRNPYFGAMMLQCGEVRGALNGPDATPVEHAGHAH